MFYTIYKTTNLINGKFYIGKHKTKELNDGYLGSGKILRRAIKKYGIENFHKEILHICKDEKHMNLLEKILVVPDKETNYNLCKGGKGGFSYINDNGLSGIHKEGVRQRACFAGGKASVELKTGIHAQTLEEKQYAGFLGAAARKKKYPEGITFKQSEQAIINQKNKFKETGHQKGPKNSQYGTMWITNGIDNMKIMKNEKIPYGWKKGRNLKNNVTQ